MKQSSCLSMSRILFAVAFCVPQFAFSLETPEDASPSVQGGEQPVSPQQNVAVQPVQSVVQPVQLVSVPQPLVVQPPVVQNTPSVEPTNNTITTNTVSAPPPVVPANPSTPAVDLTPTGEVKDSDYAPAVTDKPMNPVLTQTQDEIMRQGLSKEAQTLFDIVDQCRTAQSKCLTQAGNEVFSPYDRELRDDLILFYKEHNFQPVWINGGEWGEAVIQFFQAASFFEKEGLSPHFYGFNQGLLNGPANQTNDIRLSKAILWILKDLKSGATRTTYKDQMTIFSEKDLNPVQTLNKILAKNSPWTLEEMHAFAPTNMYYQGLYKALGDLRGQQQKGGWVLVPASNNIKQLKARLYQSGDYKPSQPKELSNATMTPALKQGISAFQKRHGFVETGSLDQKTLMAMNVSIEERIEQILMNMERARWLTDEVSDRALFVNIPDFRLEILEKGDLVHSMAVIIGRPERQTPMFEDTMTYIEFNPYWNVPPRLAVHDIGPMAKSGSFKAHGYRVFYKGKEVDGGSVPWGSYSEKNFPYRVRQDPGKHNQLGSVKFMFPNPFAVYMHDTPKKKLFDKHERYQSSGCVRVQDPRWLANYLLKNQMDETKVTDIFDKGRNRQVRLDSPVPVRLTYFTTWVDRNGQLAFRDDVYERDPLMRKAISKLRTRGMNASFPPLPTVNFASLHDIFVRNTDNPSNKQVVVPKKIMIERGQTETVDTASQPATVSVKKADASYNVKVVSADFQRISPRIHIPKTVEDNAKTASSGSQKPASSSAQSLESVYLGTDKKMDPIH